MKSFTPKNRNPFSKYQPPVPEIEPLDKPAEEGMMSNMDSTAPDNSQWEALTADLSPEECQSLSDYLASKMSGVDAGEAEVAEENAEADAEVADAEADADMEEEDEASVTA